MKANITTVTKNYVHCPECDKQCSPIDHLKDGFKSWWYCENCGVQYEIKMKDGVIDVKATEKRHLNMFVFLKNENIGLIVKGFRDDPPDPEQLSNQEYFYDEHTCPTNYLKDVVAIIDLKDGDTDPHGIFQFCGFADYPLDYSEEDCNYDFSKFIEYFGDQK